MLCDTILQDKIMQSASGWSDLANRITASNKFVLASDFTAAADGLVDNSKELERALTFCRLPYRICWFEFAQADRKTFVAAEDGSNPLLYPVHRVGFLCEASNDDFSAWTAELFWTFKQANSTSSFSMIKTKFDTSKSYNEQGLSEVNQFGLKEIIGGVSEQASTTQEAIALAKTIKDLAPNDWGGEIRFVLAMLGLLNARNVAETEHVDNTVYNRKRAKKDLPPFCSHNILKIRTSHKSMLKSDKDSTEHGMIRAHFVRGHFKQRRSGLFWWGPFMRGNMDRGYVAKDYVVTE